jgi:double-strand break repair protein MRE11
MQVTELIDKANDMWDRRNAQAVEDGEGVLPHMLPLIRLKVSRFTCFILISPQGYTG